MQPRSALVLSGGGANGAYEVGVLKALFGGKSPTTGGAPLHASSIAATSIGTFNTAVLLSHYHRRSWDEAIAGLESVWVERIAAPGATSPNGVFRYRPNFLEWIDVAQFRLNPMQPARALASDASYIARDFVARMTGFVSGSAGLATRLSELIDISTFVTPEPSAQLVQAVVNAQRLRESPIHISVTATNWANGTLRVFTNPDFTDAAATDIVRASGALPGIFPPVSIGGELYVDGGVVLNTPLKPVIEHGCDELHVVYLDPEPGAVPLPKIASTIDTMGRYIVASFAATMRRDLEVAAKVNRKIKEGKADAGHRPVTIHLYHPNQNMGGALGMLDFHRGRIETLVAAGYSDAVAHDCRVMGCLNVGD
jgi:predicted acylesterase/phospholipase RssA